MSSAKRKLRLAGAFAALASLAVAVSCKGFFTNPTVASFVISPTNPTVPLGGTTQMHAFGTDSNGNPLGDITTKITWSSTESGIVGVGTNTGLLSGVQLSTSTVTIDANFQALSQQTATASVCVDTVVSGTFQLAPPAGDIGSNDIFPNGGGMTASVEATVAGVTQTLDVTAGVQWSSSSTDLTISNGVDPATVSLTPVLTNTPVTVTATYTCNTTTITQTVDYTLTSQ